MEQTGVEGQLSRKWGISMSVGGASGPGRRRGPKTTASIDGAYVKSLMDWYGELAPAFAERCFISPSKMYEIIEQNADGSFVNPDTLPSILRQMSSKLGVAVNHLVYYDVNTLPNDPGFYERLRHGWFIDNHREQVDKDKIRNKAVVWLRESLRLKHSPADTKAQRRLSFRGSSKNCLNFWFRLRAERLTQHMFVVRSISRERAGKDSTRCWVGMFHKFIRHKRQSDESRVVVLSGVWSGIHIHGDIGVYRWVVADDVLGPEDIRHIVEASPVLPELTSNDFTSIC